MLKCQVTVVCIREIRTDEMSTGAEHLSPDADGVLLVSVTYTVLTRHFHLLTYIKS